jgi:hypothetical protein
MNFRNKKMKNEKTKNNLSKPLSHPRTQGQKGNYIIEIYSAM